MGPLKTEESAWRKAHALQKEHALNHERYTSPDALYIKDHLRFTISVADPMIAAMCVHGMLDFEDISVVAIKNKYLGDVAIITGTGSPGILVNLQVHLDPLPPLVFEVQVYIDAFLQLKELAHKSYEMTRVTDPSEILHPVFDTPNPQVVTTRID